MTQEQATLVPFPDPNKLKEDGETQSASVYILFHPFA